MPIAGYVTEELKNLNCDTLYSGNVCHASLASPSTVHSSVWNALLLLRVHCTQRPKCDRHCRWTMTPNPTKYWRHHCVVNGSTVVDGKNKPQLYTITNTAKHSQITEQLNITQTTLFLVYSEIDTATKHNQRNSSAILAHFRHVTVVKFQMCCCVVNFIKFVSRVRPLDAHNC